MNICESHMTFLCLHKVTKPNQIRQPAYSPSLPFPENKLARKRKHCHGQIIFGTILKEVLTRRDQIWVIPYIWNWQMVYIEEQCGWCLPDPATRLCWWATDYLADRRLSWELIQVGLVIPSLARRNMTEHDERVPFDKLSLIKLSMWRIRVWVLANK